jgi:hypothetical protein
MTGILDDIQKKESQRLMTDIAAALRRNPNSVVILDDERMLLRRCWSNSAKTTSELNIIRAIHGRIRGIKTPEENAKGIRDFVANKQN